MSTLEDKLKTTPFWFKIGSINHLIALGVILLGCARSGFECAGDAMSNTLSLYTFTLLTPQVAVEVIILLALFLVSGNKSNQANNWQPAFIFFCTLGLLVVAGYKLS